MQGQAVTPWLWAAPFLYAGAAADAAAAIAAGVPLGAVLGRYVAPVAHPSFLIRRRFRPVPPSRVFGGGVLSVGGSSSSSSSLLPGLHPSPSLASVVPANGDVVALLAGYANSRYHRGSDHVYASRLLPPNFLLAADMDRCPLRSSAVPLPPQPFWEIARGSNIGSGTVCPPGTGRGRAPPLRPLRSYHGVGTPSPAQGGSGALGRPPPVAVGKAGASPPPPSPRNAPSAPSALPLEDAV